MGLAPAAPTFDELETKHKELEYSDQPFKDEGVMMTQQTSDDQDLAHQDFSHDSQVPFHVFGCGGAGKVAAIRFAKSCKEEHKITTIDTSGLTDTVPGVESLRIKGLNGSGKLRRDNVSEISNFITDLTTKITFEKVNILIFSLSGGSGSLLAPLLADEILRQNKIAVIIGIIDTDSEIDTINAFNCLRTFDNISNNRKAYIPSILFNNNSGRSVVDYGIGTTLKNLSYILTSSFIALDMQDRIKFLNPQVFDGVDYGIKLLNISTRDDGEWEEDLGLVVKPPEPEKLDSILTITHTDTHLKITKRCSVIFRGYFTDPETKNIVASIGYQIPETFIKAMNSDIHAFKSTLASPKTVITSEYEIGETSKNGLVL